MKVSTAIADITPPVGVELSGYVAREQPSLGVHDPLYARALYCEADGARLLWLHADLVGFEHDYVVELKVELAARCDFAPHEIVVSATHTHSGPATVGLINCGAPDPQYLERLRDELVRLARLALAAPQPAELVTAESTCDLGLERRGRPTRHVDQRIGVLAWRRAGTYVAVLANYGMHNVGLSAANRLISSDIAGRAAATLADVLPGRPLVLFTNGAAGNINPPAVTDDYANVLRWGDELAYRVQRALHTAAPLPPTLWTTSELLEIPTLVLSPVEIDDLAARRQAPLAGQEGPIAARIRDAIERWRVRMRRACEPGPHDGSAGRNAVAGAPPEPPHHPPASHPAVEPRAPVLPVELQVVRLGGVDLVCVGAEVFSNLPDALRRTTDRPVYVVSYANGVMGYLAPRYAYEEGSYEVDQAFIWYGTLPVRRGAFELVRDRAVELLRTAPLARDASLQA